MASIVPSYLAVPRESVSACPGPDEARELFQQTRRRSRFLCEPLQPEDCVVQSMPEASPTRWHLAHTTWFFERFVLAEAVADYRPPNACYEYLFNSYYNAVGKQFPRGARGLLSRPTVAEVWDYRALVDARIERWIADASDDDVWERLSPILQIGIQHEQQHQELMLTDIKHVFHCNPLYPVYRRSRASGSDGVAALRDEGFADFAGGIVRIGHDGDGFAYDNEGPPHEALVQPFSLARRLVTNGQFVEFIEAGGYTRSEFWLSAGWATVESQQWRNPLYWVRRDGEWMEFTLSGLQPLDLDSPVCHVSFFEADALARWAGARLPTEFEWETAARQLWKEPAAHGAYLESQQWHPRPVSGGGESAPHVPRQMFGELWQWTASPYVGYPGYAPPPGAIGEYNGKFMCNQWVLRGGSVATPRSHLRPTYRNFFPPDARWQFTGIRLAR